MNMKKPWTKAITNVLLTMWAKVQIKVITVSLMTLEPLQKPYKMLVRGPKLIMSHSQVSQKSLNHFNKQREGFKYKPTHPSNKQLTDPNTSIRTSSSL